ncbi:DUF6875 domain-containing protein [Xenorhabdus littoralis]|uniref:DUF6875 domain-containing protein n=1 Tax=Xenorhabdus littoralis TaxID=2582835 RepID=UPI0029E7D54B|nr:hypothetical protein [Xenorhabdus sp. psl]MDX7993093.1 hypothetical protein [Xenorhabdus sp. psl]
MSITIHQTSEFNFQEGPLYFLETFQWIQNSIMGKFRESNKTVCPVAKYSHFSNSMFIGSLDASHRDRQRFIQEVRALIGLFDELKNYPNQDPTILSLVMVITSLPEDQYIQWIDEVHSLLKPEFMQSFQMLGEFHSNSIVDSARVPGECPMRSPYPLFVVRAMHEHDHLFIDRSGSIEKRLQELELYRAGMIENNTPRYLDKVQTRIIELKDQIN